MANLPTSSTSHFVNSHWSGLTKWKLIKWEVDSGKLIKWEVDRVGIDKVGVYKVGIDEVGINRFTIDSCVPMWVRRMISSAFLGYLAICVHSASFTVFDNCCLFGFSGWLDCHLGRSACFTPAPLWGTR